MVDFAIVIRNARQSSKGLDQNVISLVMLKQLNRFSFETELHDTYIGCGFNQNRLCHSINALVLSSPFDTLNGITEQEVQTP